MRFLLAMFVLAAAAIAEDPKGDKEGANALAEISKKLEEQSKRQEDQKNELEEVQKKLAVQEAENEKLKKEVANQKLENLEERKAESLLRQAEDNIRQADAEMIKINEQRVEKRQSAPKGKRQKGVISEAKKLMVQEILHYHGTQNYTTTLKQFIDSEIRRLTAPRKPEIVRVVNGGTAGATSVGSPSNYAPIKGFTSSGESWFNTQYQFPAGVWMRFQRKISLMKIGFRPWSPAGSGNWPKVTEVVGSDDCSRWNTLLYIDNKGGFTRNEEFRMFTIPSENRTPGYACLGLRWPSQNGCNGYVRVGNIQMWEQV